MALNPGSTPTTTTVATNATPQTVTPAGLAAAEFVNIVNTGPVPVTVSWWDLRGIQLSAGPIANSLQIWAGAVGGIPFPVAGAITVSSALPGQVAITVQS